MVRGDRLLVEATIAADVNEPGKQLRIVAMADRLAQKPNERSLRLPHVGLELRVKLVRHREPRVELERPAERLLRAGVNVR